VRDVRFANWRTRLNLDPTQVQVPLTCQCPGDWDVYALGERRFDAKGNLRGVVLHVTVCKCNAPSPEWLRTNWR